MTRRGILGVFIAVVVGLVVYALLAGSGYAGYLIVKAIKHALEGK